MRNKLWQMSLILMFSITLLVVASIILYKYVLFPDKPSNSAAQASGSIDIDEMADLSVPIEEITTNLADDRIIAIQFSLISSNKEAKKELEKGIFLVKREIIGILSSMKSEDLRGEEGVNALEARILQRVNRFLQHGKVLKVITTRKVIQ